MNRYLKLVHMEVHRFRFILAGLMGLTAICQIGALIWKVVGELSSRTRYKELMGIGESSYSPAKLSFAWVIQNTQQLFAISILLCIAALVLYVFLIWYRDWIGRDTFIYRLLMLPTARRHIYMAKLTAILMFVFGMVSFQLLLLPVEKMIFNIIVPADMREPSYLSNAISLNQTLNMLLPLHLDEFLASYGLGIVGVLAVFTAILLERSYRRLGILYAIAYLALCAAAVIFPVASLGVGDANAFLYPIEIFAIELAVIGVVLITSVWLGFRLIEKKITV